MLALPPRKEQGRPHLVCRPVLVHLTHPLLPSPPVLGGRGQGEGAFATPLIALRKLIAAAEESKSQSPSWSRCSFRSCLGSSRSTIQHYSHRSYHCSTNRPYSRSCQCRCWFPCQLTTQRYSRRSTDPSSSRYSCACDPYRSCSCRYCCCSAGSSAHCPSCCCCCRGGACSWFRCRCCRNP